MSSKKHFKAWLVKYKAAHPDKYHDEDALWAAWEQATNVAQLRALRFCNKRRETETGE